MAISRMQMNRELYAGGGILSLTPRSKFGLGSKIKRTVRKIIPNEVSSIAVKAAPFVAPFNPALAGAMSGLGTFDQTGSIGQSVKAGLINYGLGQAGRYIGGAGFQGNPFAAGGAFTPSGFMSGFSSPFGTQTGIGKLLSDKGFIGTKTLPTDPGVATESIFAQPGQPGTYTYGDFGADKIILEPGSITPSGQIVSGTAAQNQAVLDQIAKQTVPGVTENVVQKATQRGYGDVFKDVFSGDLNKSTSALKELGGKALKDIYTNPVRNAAGEIVDTQVDKLAVGATIAGVTSYIEARKLAEEAGLVDDAEEYTEEMYEADKARYKDYYSKILTPESFGLKDGGIISLRKMKQSGSIPEEFISYTDDESGVIYRDPEGNPITKAEAMKAFDEMPPEEQVLTDMEGKPLGEPETRKRILPMPKPKEFVFKRRLDTLMKAKSILEPESFEYLLNELKNEMSDAGIPSIKLEKKATGGRVGFKDGSDDYDPYDKVEKKIIQIDPLQQDLDDQLGIGAALAPGLIKLMSRGAPKFTSAEKTMVIRNLAGRSKGSPEYKELGMSIPEAKAIMDEPAKYLKDATILKEFVKTIMGKKDGGRIGLKDGPGKDGLQNFKVGDYKPFKYTGAIDDVWEADLGGDPLADIVKIGYTVRAPLIDIIRGVAKTGKEAASLIAAATKAGYDLTKPVRETIGDIAGGVYDVAKKTIQESGDASRFIQPLYYLERFAPEKNLTDDETRLRRLKRSIGRDDRDLIKTIENRIFGYDDAGINQNEEDKEVSRQIQADIDSRGFGFKKGGRVKYAMGSEVPVRDNGMGVTEMDFRETGGFVPPIGVKEKADDIPAMLSNNEFVFTADAVRAAGGGSVNKGAQKMYALMKQLEGKVV